MNLFDASQCLEQLPFRLSAAATSFSRSVSADSRFDENKHGEDGDEILFAVCGTLREITPIIAANEHTLRNASLIAGTPMVKDFQNQSYDFCAHIFLLETVNRLFVQSGVVERELSLPQVWSRFSELFYLDCPEVVAWVAKERQVLFREANMKNGHSAHVPTEDMTLVTAEDIAKFTGLGLRSIQKALSGCKPDEPSRGKGHAHRWRFHRVIKWLSEVKSGRLKTVEWPNSAAEMRVK